MQTEPGSLSLPPGISLQHPLEDEEAVAIALWNNAAFQSLLTDLGLARADIVMAGQIRNPTFLTFFPLGPKQLEFTARFPVEALWLRKRRVASAEFQAGQVAERMVQGGLDLVRDVKLACADQRLADSTAELKRESADLLNQIAALAESRLRAGDISELEVATARLAAMSADQESSRATANAKLAQAHLTALLGLGQTLPGIVLADLPPSPEPIRRGVDEFATDALANRPDLRAAELALEAAGERIDLARREIYTLTAILDTNGTGSNFEIGPGVEFEIPIFNQNQGGIAIADARLEQAVRQYVSVRDQIVLEVRQAHIRWEQSLSALRHWNDQLQPVLEEAVVVARNGVQSGDLPPLQALEAERTLNDALSSQQVAVAEWQGAIAELEHAIGHRLALLPNQTAPSPSVTP